METAEIKTPVHTEVIRTQVAGPKPCNTLAFIRCAGPTLPYDSSLGDLFRYKIRFPTMFRIDGFTQANHEWYRENTLVSATAFFRILNVTDDAGTVFAIDTIAADINADGRLAFELQLASQVSTPGFNTQEIDAVYSYRVSAYVLVYEPRVEPPPPGHFGKKLFFNTVPPPLETKEKKKTLIFDDLRIFKP